MARAKFISVVSPCYNEEGNVQVFAEAVSRVLAGHNYEILLVDDGSRDGTLEKVRLLAKHNPNIKYISLSRNFGHQNALWAGLTYARGDCVISLDADLQHPVELIPEMLDNYEKGYDVVYTIRQDTEKTGFIKKLTSRLFYKINNMLSSVNVPNGAADFRLLDRKVVDSLLSSCENMLFLRGMVVWAGFRQIAMPYQVAERHSGVSKYSVRKMVNLAFAGITSFSIKPLFLSFYLGGFCLFAFVVGILYQLLSYLLALPTFSWLPVLLVMTFFQSLLFFCLGVIGFYLGVAFLENKRRPNFLVQETNVEKCHLHT